MKRSFIILLIMFTFCIGFSGTGAFGAQDIVIDIASVSPSELSGDGTVTISFELSNHSDKDISSISVSLDDNVFEFPESTVVPASGSAILPISLPLTVSQLDTPLVFTIKWISEGEPYYATAETTVARVVDPTISLTRTVSTKHARKGQQVTVTYTLKNPSKFDMTEVTLIDEQISDDAIRKNDTLRANGGFSIEYSFTMGTTDIVSSPFVTYMVNGKTKSYSDIKPVTVVYSDIAVEISAEKKNSDLSGTSFEITLKNSGASDVFGLTVLDSDGTKVNDEPVDLKAGESRVFSYMAAPLTSNQPKKISFTYTGKDSFGDELEPENTQVFLINPVFDDSQFSVHLSVEVLTRPTAQNNAAEIKFSIDNKSVLPLFDIRIVELNLGEIATEGTLSNGVTELIRWVPLDSDRDLEFFIEGIDGSGAGHQLDSVILSREFLLPDATPEPTQTAAAIDTDYLPRTNIWGNFIFRILVILGAVMVLSCAVLIALRVLDVGRVEVKDNDDFSNIFDLETEEPMNEQDSRYYDEGYDDIKPRDVQQDGGRDSFASFSEGNAPKHLQLKKQPAKKIRKKTETRRINRN